MRSKLLSILIPSRSRSKHLEYVITNIVDKFNSIIEDIEINIRLDTDDSKNYQHIIDKDYGVAINYIVGDRLEGYVSLPAFFTELIQISKGTFLLPYNDDVRIIDVSELINFLVNNKENPCIINESDTSGVPVVHYKIFEILGNEIIPELVYYDAHINYLRTLLPEERRGRVSYSISHPVIDTGEQTTFYNILMFKDKEQDLKIANEAGFFNRPDTPENIRAYRKKLFKYFYPNEDFL